jgi:adenosine deaminase
MFLKKMPTTNRIEGLIQAAPKTELHLHLEGAIPLETLYALIQRQGGDPSVNSIEDLEQKLTYTDFAHFIELWIWKNTFITEEQDFETIAYQVLRNLSEQNVKYVEAFYSPGDYTHKGLTVQGITEYLIKGKERARQDFGIRCELIVDIVRGDGVEVGMQRLDETEPYLGKGLIGIGLGGSEHKFPADPYAPVYKEAKRRGFRLTAHAGEAVGPPSIWAVIRKLGCERIGHGVRANEDPVLVAYLKEHQIPLELCVVSNVRTRVCESVESHPIRQYYNEGLMVTVNSDDPVMFNTTLTHEYLMLAQHLNFAINDLRQLTLNGIDAAFLSEKEKASMKAKFEREWHNLLEKHP